jgi:hypothetical protein
MKKMKIIPVLIALLVVLAAVVVRPRNGAILSPSPQRYWPVQAIDTVKYSRDVARQYLNNPVFDEVINGQVAKIASAGATHVAISTPYDDEFIPYMERWVNAARANGLKVWFRGNFSGWEGWFDYPKISRVEHLDQLKEFIAGNGDLFADGDIFTACTECENGGPGDPRANGDVIGFRQFLIDEYRTGREAFRLVDKNVVSNYFPMNGDVAKLIMDKPTTQALGGVVVIDHYVKTPEILDQSINDLALSSGGKIVVGEFGAPIPDIHGRLTDSEQADWIDRAFKRLAHNPNVIGVNYWTGVGGSTGLWREDGAAKPAAEIITAWFKMLKS